MPLAFIDALAAKAKEFEIPLHCDGARLANGAISIGSTMKRCLQGVDSCSVCLSKGLSAPVGSMIGGTDEFIWHARRLRKVREILSISGSLIPFSRQSAAGCANPE